MRNMSDSDFMFFFDISQEWTSVVDAERENTVPVGDLERSAEHGAVAGLEFRLQIQSVPGRQHCEL